jgi:UDP-N-acetyl-D-mannosaminuronic acid dehydrogenase
MQRPKEVVKIVKKALNTNKKSISGKKISVVGLAMKDNCADYRYSPALDIINLLNKLGADINAFDPVIGKVFPYQVDTLTECIDQADCLVITALQPNINFYPDQLKRLMKNPPIVVDTRNCFSTNDKEIKIYKL